MNGFNRGYGGNQRRRPAQQQRAPQLSEKAAQALNASPEDVRQAAQNGDLTALTSRKLQRVLPLSLSPALQIFNSRSNYSGRL